MLDLLPRPTVAFGTFGFTSAMYLCTYYFSSTASCITCWVPKEFDVVENPEIMLSLSLGHSDSFLFPMSGSHPTQELVDWVLAISDTSDRCSCLFASQKKKRELGQRSLLRLDAGRSIASIHVVEH